MRGGGHGGGGGGRGGPGAFPQGYQNTGGHGGGHGGHGSGDSQKKEKEISHWRVFCKTLPYLWPPGEWLLRIRMLLSMVFLALGNLGDLATPIAIKMAIDDLTHTPDPKFPLFPVLLYGGLRMVGTIAQQIRDILFANISAHIERTIALETFVHLQSLSLSFHLRRETGSVIRSVSRGASSFSTLLRIVIHQISPVFVQVAVVCGYLLWKYDYYFALITTGIIVIYMVFTFTTTDWRDKHRRVMNEKDNEFNQKSIDALLNFETVKYFNAEKHEERRYDEALQGYKQANILTQQSLAFLNSGQNVIISVGVVGAMYLAAKKVTAHEFSVGDFVFIQQIILQLYQPLGFLGTYYRMIKQNIVDVESMYKLLSEPTDIKDAPNAKNLQLKDAEIQFHDVTFGYDKEMSQPILKNVSFIVKPGQKVAIVGPTGAGKSTIARLLYRFYEINSGRITVDGQDIKYLKQESLRQEIGIVPQDCVLFNDTIGYNIGYGIYGRHPEGATQQQIEDAAKAAAIHDFILTQPDGYQTKVGERGLRLSGGEKQRVAIARAILKRPRIMIFDEATSSLDTQTENSIQQALDAVAQGRSSITIAHRLSTIMNADQILVLDAGRIVERGTHDELVAMNGVYRRMWDRQEMTAQLKAHLAKIESDERAEKRARSPVFGAEQISETIAIPPTEDEKKQDVRVDVVDDDEDEDEDGGDVVASKPKKKGKGGKKGGNGLNEPLLPATNKTSMHSSIQ